MARQRGGEELQQRVCRACQGTYEYPLPRSLATRFYCESCMGLPAEVRAMFEKYNRRIRDLTSQVEQLRRELDRRQSTGAAPSQGKMGI